MNKFATGMLLGGAAAMAGMGYLMKDKRTYQKLARKGKKMVVKAEEAIDDIMDDMMPRTAKSKRANLSICSFCFYVLSFKKGKGIILMFSKGGPFLLTPL